MLYRIYRLWLVVLNGYNYALWGEYSCDCAKPSRDLLRKTAEQRIVTGDIRLALAGICNHGIDCAQSRYEFFVCWECRAAHADYACLAHYAYQLVCGQIPGSVADTLLFLRHIEHIVFYDHRQHFASVLMRPLFNRLDYARDRCMYRCAETVYIAYFLAQKHSVARFNKRSAYLSYVLNERYNYFFGRFYRNRRLIRRNVFMLRRTNTAAK